MGIVLTALLFIGRLLLVILAVILVLCALVLFVPIRYRLRVAGEDGVIDAGGRASWLFRLLVVEADLRKKLQGAGADPPEGKAAEEEHELRFTIRILGISPAEVRRQRAEKQRKKRKEKKKKEIEEIRAEDPARYEEMKEAARVRREERAAEERRRAEEEARLAEEAAKREREAQEAGREEENPLRGLIYRILVRLAGLLAEILRRTWRAARKAFMLPASVTGAIFKIVSKIQEICDKINAVLAFAGDRRTLRALRVVKKRGIRALKSIRPRSFSGDLRFGTGDPGSTGEVLAAASAVYPLYAGKLALTPDFDKKVLEGDVRASGKIRIGSLLLQALLIVLSRDVRFVWRTLKKR